MLLREDTRTIFFSSCEMSICGAAFTLRKWSNTMFLTEDTLTFCYEMSVSDHYLKKTE